DLLGLGDDGLRPRLVLRARLKDQNVVRELDGQRVVGTVDPEHTVGELLRRRTRGGAARPARTAGTTATACRRRRRDERLDVVRAGANAERLQVERRLPAALLYPLRRIHHAVGVAVFGVDLLDEHVAEHRIAEPRLDAVDQPAWADV